MDSVTSSHEGDWAERKELEKNERYGMHLYFINYLSALNGRPWNCTQANFIVEARGSLKRTQFQDRLCLLRVGVTNVQSQRQNPSAYGVKNASLVGHYPQAFPRLYLVQPRVGS